MKDKIIRIVTLILFALVAAAAIAYALGYYDFTFIKR